MSTIIILDHDYVFPYIIFDSADNFTYVKNAELYSELVGNYYVYAANGVISEYNNGINIDDENILEEKLKNNKKLVKSDEYGDIQINSDESIYDDLNLLIYGKGEYYYANIDGKEYKYTRYHKNDYYGKSFNEDQFLYVKRHNIYFAAMSDYDTGKKYLYTFFKEKTETKDENDNTYIYNVIDETERNIDIEYVVGNKLYYKKRIEKANPYNSKWIISRYEFGQEKEDLYEAEGYNAYYCSEIDTAFVLRRVEIGNTHYYWILEIINENGIELLEEYVDESNILETPHGIYYTTRGETGALYYYNGKKNKIRDGNIITRMEHSDDYRFLYVEYANEQRANLNDYFILPNKNDDYYKNSIGNANIENYLYYDTSVYVINKEKIKKLSDNAEILKSDDKIIVATYKKRKMEKIDLKQALESVKYFMSSIFPYGSQTVENYLLYMERDIQFTYIFDGDRGSRFNIGDKYTWGARDYIIKDNTLSCSGDGLYSGSIKYEAVSNLYKLLDGNKIRIQHVNIKDGKVYIYYMLINKEGYDYNRIDFYCYCNGTNELILENVNGAYIIEDNDNNVYILEKSTANTFENKETLYKLINKNEGIDKEKIVEEVTNLINIRFCTKSYDEVFNEGFYYTDDLTNKSIVGKSFKEDAPDLTILKDIDKSSMIDLNNSKNVDLSKYEVLDEKYVEGSKAFYQKENVKVYNFYNQIYIYLNNELKLIDNSTNNPIVYDAINDEYYYSKSTNKAQKGIDADLECIKLTIKDGIINKKVIARTSFKSKNFEPCDLKYLGRLGEYYIFTELCEGRIYAGKGDGNVEEIGQCIADYWSTERSRYQSGKTSGLISINSYENKLYYMCENRLYEVNQDLKITKIANAVEQFISLQNEVLYKSGSIYRYKDGESKKIFESAYQLYGHHNDTKCYMLLSYRDNIKDVFYIENNAKGEVKSAWEDWKDYWFQDACTIYLYENGVINKLIDEVKIPTTREGSMNGAYMKDAYLLTQDVVSKENKIDFNIMYDICKNVKNKERHSIVYEFLNKYGQNLQIKNFYLINGYNIYNVNIQDDYKTKSVKSEYRIDYIRDGVVKFHDSHDKYLELQFNEEKTKTKYDVEYSEDEYIKQNNENNDITYTIRRDVELTENYLYDLFS